MRLRPERITNLDKKKYDFRHNPTQTAMTLERKKTYIPLRIKLDTPNQEKHA